MRAGGSSTHADAVIARLEAAEADLARGAGDVSGRVRVASFQTAAHALVIPALGPLEERHPELHCELVQADAENALPGLRLGDVDMVIAEEYDHAPRPRDPALEHRELCRDALVLRGPRRATPPPPRRRSPSPTCAATSGRAARRAPPGTT